MFQRPAKYLLVLGVVLATVAPAGLCTAPPLAKAINVKSFGAKGDGATDDQLAIQNAFNAASSSPGTTVFFPPGNYLHSDTLTGTSMSIRGSAATLTSTVAFKPVELSGTQISVSGMTFDTTKGCDGIVFMNADRFTVTGSAFGPKIQAGVFMALASNGIVSGNNFGSETGVNVTHSNKVRIDHNSIHSSHPAGGIGLLVGFSTDVAVSDNQIQDEQHGVLIGENERISIVNNSIVNARRVILSSSDTDVTIRQNLLQASGEQDDFSFGVGILEDKNVLITGNSFSNCYFGLEGGECTDFQVTQNALKTCRVGVLAQGMTRFVLSSNQISEIQTTGIFVRESPGPVSVTKNNLRDCGLDDKGFPFPAVIYTDNAVAHTEIASNTYRGNSSGLTWFIRCLQSPPQAKVSGNLTNTMLPTVVGP